MRISHMVLKEIWHRKLSSLLVLGAVALCVGLIVLILRLQAASNAELRRAMELMGRDVVVLPEGVRLDACLAGDVGDETLPQTYIGLAAKTEPPVLRNLRAYYQRKAVIGGERNARQVIVRGVGPEIDGATDPQDSVTLAPREAELGSEARQRLEPFIQDKELHIPYQGLASGGGIPMRPSFLTKKGPRDRAPKNAPADVRVRAVRKPTGTIRDYMVFLNINVARRLYGEIDAEGNPRDVVNVIEAEGILTPETDIGNVVEKLKRHFRDETPGVSVYSLRGMAEARQRAVVSRARKMALVELGVFVFGALIVGGYSVLNVRQRRKEMGALLAVALRPRHVAWMVVEKMLIVALVGGALGCWLGAAGAAHWGPAAAGEALPATWQTSAVGLALALALTLVPGLAGVYLAAHVDPAETLRDL